MQIKNDRRLSPWDLERDSSVLIPIPLENSTDVQSGEIRQGVTAAVCVCVCVGGWVCMFVFGGGVRIGPQVFTIKINLLRQSIKKEIPQ